MTHTHRLPRVLLALLVTAALALPAAAMLCPPMESPGSGEMVCPLMAAGACDMDAETEASQHLSRSLPECCTLTEIPTPDRTITIPAPTPGSVGFESVPEVSEGLLTGGAETTAEPPERSSPTPLFTLHQAFLI